MIRWVMAPVLFWIIALPGLEPPPAQGVILHPGATVGLVLCAVGNGAGRGTVLSFRRDGATLTWSDGSRADFDALGDGGTIIRLRDAAGAPDPDLTAAMAGWLEGCP